MSEQRVWSEDLATSAFEPYEVGRCLWLRRDEVGGRELWAGIWDVRPDELAPGSLHETTHEETFYVLEGRVRLEIEGAETLDLGPGAMASLRRGSQVRWTVLEPLRQFFVYT